VQLIESRDAMLAHEMSQVSCVDILGRRLPDDLTAEVECLTHSTSYGMEKPRPRDKPLMN
jgi:hypothetical protein